MLVRLPARERLSPRTASCRWLRLVARGAAPGRRDWSGVRASAPRRGVSRCSCSRSSASGTTSPIAAATRVTHPDARARARRVDRAVPVACAARLATVAAVLASRLRRRASAVAASSWSRSSSRCGAWYARRASRTAARRSRRCSSKYPAFVRHRRSPAAAGRWTLAVRLSARRSPPSISRRCAVRGAARRRPSAAPRSARSRDSIDRCATARIVAPASPVARTRVAATSAAPRRAPFITARGRPDGQARARSTSCGATRCGLAYQNPRVPLEHIRRLLRRRVHRASAEARLGRADAALRARDGQARRRQGRHRRRATSSLDRRRARCSTSAAASARSCSVCTTATASHATGVDFKDLSSHPSLARTSSSTAASSTTRRSRIERFDLVTMWHFLEHDYDPLRSLRTAQRVLKPDGRLVIEVPRLDSRTFRLFGDRWPGLQAPQHTVLFDREQPAARSSARPASRSSTTCPTARSPPTSISSPARRSAAEGARPQPGPGDRIRTSSGKLLARADPRVRAAAEPRHADGRLPEAVMSAPTARSVTRSSTLASRAARDRALAVAPA